jgi:hypothetical protein
MKPVLKALILGRDGFTGRMCGAASGEAHPHDSSQTTRLEIGYASGKPQGSSGDLANLRAP